MDPANHNPFSHRFHMLSTVFSLEFMNFVRLTVWTNAMSQFQWCIFRNIYSHWEKKIPLRQGSQIFFSLFYDRKRKRRNEVVASLFASLFKSALFLAFRAFGTLGRWSPKSEALYLQPMEFPLDKLIKKIDYSFNYILIRLMEINYFPNRFLTLGRKKKKNKETNHIF